MEEDSLYIINPDKIIEEYKKGKRDFSQLSVVPSKKGTQFKDKNLSSIIFSGSRIVNFSFENCNLTDANFEEAELSNCSFKKAILKNTKFSKANLFYTNFENAVFHNTNFKEANLKWAELKGTKKKEMPTLKMLILKK